jgi:IQ and ubiquitin-like domain-containing protein
MQLSDLGVEPNGIIQLKIASVDQQNFPLKEYETKEKYVSPPDVITVHINLENNNFKEIIVEIEKSNIKKPFLGGFKNKHTNKEFFNASSQTNRKIKPDNGIQKFCRDTQTVVSHHTLLQTRQDMSTQMTKPGVFVSRIEDKLITPRPYETAEQRQMTIIRSVITIQKYYRRWLAKRRFTHIKTGFEDRIRYEKEKEMQRINEIEERRQLDIQRRLNPRTKDDFEILYSALEKWRFEELTKINATKTGASRKAALAMLVDQEAELIATIERYKIEANKENKEKRIQFLLEKVKLKFRRFNFREG